MSGELSGLSTQRFGTIFPAVVRKRRKLMFKSEVGRHLIALIAVAFAVFLQNSATSGTDAHRGGSPVPSGLVDFATISLEAPPGARGHDGVQLLGSDLAVPVLPALDNGSPLPLQAAEPSGSAASSFAESMRRSSLEDVTHKMSFL
jgi:hypothetical protein